MKKFRINEKVIEAEQWFYGKEIEGVRGDTEDLTGGNGLSPQPAMAFVATRKGMVKVFEGDLIVSLPNNKKSVLPFEVLELIGGTALSSDSTPFPVAKITDGENEYYTKEVDDLERFKSFKIEMLQMTEAEFSKIPATMESKEFFNV